jgi:hypothetical protein
MQSGLHSDNHTIGKRPQSVQVRESVRSGHIARVTT